MSFPSIVLPRGNPRPIPSLFQFRWLFPPLKDVYHLQQILHSKQGQCRRRIRGGPADPGPTHRHHHVRAVRENQHGMDLSRMVFKFEDRELLTEKWMTGMYDFSLP